GAGETTTSRAPPGRGRDNRGGAGETGTSRPPVEVPIALVGPWKARLRAMGPQPGAVSAYSFGAPAAAGRAAPEGLSGELEVARVLGIVAGLLEQPGLLG